MYIQNGNTTAAINNAAGAGWIQLKRGIQGISFHVNLPATGTPVGTFIFEITNDDDPRNGTTGVILGASAITLAAPYNSATFQPTDGLARNVVFDFGDSPMVNGCPSAKWMRMRYAPTSGGGAGLNVDVHQRGI